MLERDFGIKLLEPLKRQYIKIGLGDNYVEVNIIGRGQRNGKQVWIVGECKPQLKEKPYKCLFKECRAAEEGFF